MVFVSAKRKKIKEKDLQGFKYFKAISGMLESLHEAGVVFDRKVRLGSDRKTKEQLSIPVRLIAIKCTPHVKRAKTGRGGPQQGETLLIATDRFAYN